MKKLLSLTFVLIFMFSALGAWTVSIGAENADFLVPITGTVQGTGYEHAGVDIHASKGTPVYAVADGTIIYSEFGHTPVYSGYEDVDTRYSVKIELNEPLEYNGQTYVNAFYTHLSGLVYEVNQNQPATATSSEPYSITVEAGDLIGYSGLGRGVPHLHFSFETFDTTDSAGYEHMGTDDLIKVLGWSYGESITATTSFIESSTVYNSTTFDPVWPCGSAWSITTNYFYWNNGSVKRHATRSNYYNSNGYLNAIDISGGGNILAIESGKVNSVVTGCSHNYSSYCGCNGGFGNYVVIKHSNGMYSLYGHLGKVSVSSGSEITKGQVIGVMGSTGDSSGTHLHLELYDSNYSTTNIFRNYFESKYRANIKIGTNSKAAAEKVLSQNWAYTTSGGTMTPTSTAKDTLQWYLNTLNTYYTTQSSGWYYYNGSTPETCTCSTSYADTYVCTTTTYPLTIRSGHSTSYGSLGTIPSGAEVTVSKANGSWAHITYNGISGLASMEYLERILPHYTGYPTPFKSYAISSAHYAAEAYDAANGNLIGYIYGTDYCTVKQIYSNGWCLANVPWEGTTKDVYTHTYTFIDSTKTPYTKVVENKVTTYVRLTSDTVLGWVDPGDKITVVDDTKSGKVQIIYPHTDGTYRCAWIDPSGIAHTHTPGASATCVSPQVCTTCDAVLVSIKSHTPGSAATCTSPQICTYCKTVLVEAIGHSAGAAATCTTAQTCKTCGTTLVAAKGHTWDSGYVSRKPTCIQTGNLTKTCTTCKTVKDFNIVIVPDAHTWDSGTVTKAATCTATGVKTYKCTNKVGTISCTVTKTETIAATGHSASDIYYEHTHPHKMFKRCTYCGNDKLYTGENYPSDISCSTCYPVSGVTLNTSISTITVGNTLTLTATISPSNAANKNVSWTSSNTSIATVSNGVVTAKAAGTATITVKTSDGSKTATCTVTVKANTVSVTGVTLNKTEATLTVGDTLTLTATVAPSNATNKNVSWTSSNTSVATVSNGVVTAKASGTATITVKTTDGNKTASCKITVNKTVDENSPAITVASVSGRAGNTVDVTISIKNNPGIISMLLDVTYDSKYLTLTEIKNGDILNGATHDVTLLNANPYTLSWADDTAQDNNTSNGMIVTFKFKIAENAPVGSLPITVTYDNGNAAIYDKDMQLVDFDIVNGAVEVKDYLIGDLNDDGKVNSFDRTILARYIAKWDGYKASDFVYEAADVNNDGNVNAFDRTILARHISKWTEYSVLPYIK
ncbi:MAG: peptidoglycan DD-metalloendopeptidase family protein [Clostridia bacterium]|nr:peptidoglycan DD-metalloendopeptidase family protein [Clostridia bacterium]